MILTGSGVSTGSFVVLEIADEEKAFEVARRIAESTGREVTVRDANWIELAIIPGGKKHWERLDP
ncbi:hypothetical protein QA640_32145 [Bradyrhizobium sp. CB82]|uniref:hypothetical protein n=1 Tax=Bradyrhizobium sp. CB82 TaxID=3039159 RepID=UPI0024B27616|nr:hypothetical protein [Bradyrhizobium sp. CB82]WFU39014.1 hypothetical protein QA640_32145 [Bradyrhizobium sp. CB82]